MKQKIYLILIIKKFKIFIHPDSYVHAIIKFKNGLTKILIHDTRSMKIPIFNAIYFNDNNKKISSKEIDLKKLNNLNFKKVDIKNFQLLKF